MEGWTGTVTFGSRGNYGNWAGVGWSVPEYDWTWMDGYQATLEFRAPPPRFDQLLTVQVMPVQSQLRQFMDIYLNGRFIGILAGTPERTDQWTFPVRRKLFDLEDPNVFAFSCPHAVIPAEEGSGADQRRLSFAFLALTLREQA
jgi:hypothetical protein